MIVVKNVSKAFGDIEAVKNASFSIESGICALLGVNGAGKTTLIRMIAGILPIDSGSIEVCDKNVSTNREEALANIGYVPENNPMYEEMTSYEYIKFFSNVWNVSHENFIEAIKLLANNLEIVKVMNQKVSTLSKGYKRRVALAASLIHQPKVLILDEPTDGLDPNQKILIRNFLKEYSKENIVLISTHIMEDVEIMAQRVLLMNDGEIIKDKTPKEIKEDSKNKSLIDAFSFITRREDV